MSGINRAGDRIVTITQQQLLGKKVRKHGRARKVQEGIRYHPLTQVTPGVPGSKWKALCGNPDIYPHLSGSVRLWEPQAVLLGATECFGCLRQEARIHAQVS